MSVVRFVVALVFLGPFILAGALCGILWSAFFQGLALGSALMEIEEEEPAPEELRKDFRLVPPNYDARL